MKITLLSGGKDPHYVLGLLSGIIGKLNKIELIGSEEMGKFDILRNKGVIFYNFYGTDIHYKTIPRKIIRIVKYYVQLVKYAAKTDSNIFHVQWLNKFTFLDRTVLNIYYKVLGKKLVFTAHNINELERDGEDTLINRVSLKFMYVIVDHIIAHTEKMKLQLIENYHVKESKITVIPFGINNIVMKSGLKSEQAKEKLGLGVDNKVILFFGNIAPYKGLEHLILALAYLRVDCERFKLIIVGRIKKDCEAYWETIQRMIEKNTLNNYIMKKIEFIPDQDIELYFKSADVLVLPYNYIFQSGVLFLSYSFGLPVIATDVGSLREEIVEGRTGFICRPEDSQDLAEKINLYFNSELFKNLESNREKIIKYANEKYSWDKVAEKTCAIYKSLL